MRGACIAVVILGACGSEPATSLDAKSSFEDGLYVGIISASGCIAGKPFSIDVVAGKASFPSSTYCSTNTATADGQIDYACGVGGGENHYRCMSQGTVIDSSDIVHASLVGSKLMGTIMHDEKTLVPPNCTVQSTCVDSGTFELVRQ